MSLDVLGLDVFLAPDVTKSWEVPNKVCLSKAGNRGSINYSRQEPRRLPPFLISQATGDLA